MRTSRTVAERSAVLLVLLLLALTLTACRQGGGGGSVDDPFEYPEGADDVVLRIETSGPPVPPQVALVTQPRLLMTGDGAIYGPVGDVSDRLTTGSAAAYIPMQRIPADAAAVDEMLRAAFEAQLLQEPPPYETSGGRVTGAPVTTVTLTADGETWTHRAPALGFGPETGDRARLADFVEQAEMFLPDASAEPYEPEQMRLHVSERSGPPVPDGDVVDWPVAAVDLSAIDDCALVPAGGIAEALAEAGVEASFRDDRATYVVSAAAVLPGDEGCPTG